MPEPFDITRDDHHDRYLRKNMSLSRAYDMDRKDKEKAKDARGEIKHEMKACHKCKNVKPCVPHYIMETGRFEGVTSVSKEQVFICDDCNPAKKKQALQMSKQKINALLRGAKKGRI